jgi:sialate O-acetylesterase
MIKPIEPYAIKGVLWYQGESITEGLELYPVVMEHVITSWRQQWGQGEFPFYFVQLAKKGTPREEFEKLFLLPAERTD